MRLLSWLITIGEAIAIVFGLYNEWAPAGWPLRQLPNGMGYALALVAAPMALNALVIERDRQERAEARSIATLWDRLSSQLSLCLPTHERDFYALWHAQVETAKHNVDVTHLGRRPPQNRHGDPETKYFTTMKELFTKSQASIRRIERYAPEKQEWIQQLVNDFTGVQNFSLRLYMDPLPGEMPAAFSVCRIDNRYAWIVAIAEQESTGSIRDLLLTGGESVELVRNYFQKRLWDKSIPVLDRGCVQEGWDKELKK